MPSARSSARASPPRRTNAELSAETQHRLLAAARAEFAEVGYAAASTERIVAAAGLTRGALYHHYRGKRELFEAVFIELQRELLDAVDTRASRAASPFDGVVSGCEAWLDACANRDVHQIVLLDGPAVLGWERWMQIDADHGVRSLREGIDACIAARQLVDVDAGVLTHLLSGALNELALVSAHAGPSRPTRRAARETLRALLAGLRRRRRD